MQSLAGYRRDPGRNEARGSQLHRIAEVLAKDARAMFQQQRVQELPQHQPNGGELYERGGPAEAVLEILGHPATAIELRDRPLHNPPFRYDDKARSRTVPFEDLRLELRADFRCG